ncbi:BQ2448_1607 [Microbotryum intermedium]|uniref:BQ2448_1607 protein n=1 Tax=Microbotryum intermedium TaxID=269621 RepID=A0A238FDY1_9BASI|nr:BQ2448_1607 [Microbotryum intermedium]
MQGRIRFGPTRGIKTKSRASPIVSGPQPVCQACQTQFSRYTCPSCNLHYCTLTCYRSPSHSTCSEAFDRQSLMDEIRSSEGTSTEQRGAMMGMLKRFEEQQAVLDEGPVEEDESREGSRHLMEKLQGIDLDSIDPSQLLEYLSPTQRAEFDDLLKDSTKIEALMSAHDELKTPWWEQTAEEEEGAEKTVDVEKVPAKNAVRPALLSSESLPPLKLGDDGEPIVGPGLLNNIVAVLLVYCYLVRTFSLSSLVDLIPSTMDHQEAYQILVRLVPFLTTQSTFVFASIEEALQRVFKTEMVESDSTVSTVFQITQDVIQILTPIPIIPLDDSDDLPPNPHANTLAALADLVTYFYTFTQVDHSNKLSSSSSKTDKVEAKPASMKLRFYYAFVAKLGEVNSQQVGHVRDQVGRVGRVVARKWEMTDQLRKDKKGNEEMNVVMNRKGDGTSKSAIIEELGEEDGEGTKT